MGHDHSHRAGHGTAKSRLGFAFVLNVGFTIVELIGAWFTNSTAIAADALHDLGDSLSLAFAWGMQVLGQRPPDATYTYGFRRLSLVGALANALVLLIGGIVVLTQAIPRLAAPEQPDALGMMGLAVFGVAVNGAAVLRVRSGTSLNEKLVTWHLMEDVLGWIAVLIAGFVLQFADVPIIDPILSIAITVWVGFNAARNLKRTLDLFLQAVPADVDIPTLCRLAAEVPRVRALQHVHVWSHDGERHVLTGQLLVDPMSLDAAIEAREQVQHALHAAGIDHATLEVTTDDDEPAACEAR